MESCCGKEKNLSSQQSEQQKQPTNAKVFKVIDLVLFYLFLEFKVNLNAWMQGKRTCDVDVGGKDSFWSFCLCERLFLKDHEAIEYFRNIMKFGVYLWEFCDVLNNIFGREMLQSLKEVSKKIAQRKEDKAVSQKQPEKIGLLRKNLLLTKKYFLTYCSELLNLSLMDAFEDKEFFNQFHFILFDLENEQALKKNVILPFDHRLLSTILIHKHPSIFQRGEHLKKYETHPVLFNFYQELYEMTNFEYLKKILTLQANTTRVILHPLVLVFSEIIKNQLTTKEQQSIISLNAEIEMGRMAKQILSMKRNEGKKEFEEKRKAKREELMEIQAKEKKKLNLYQGYKFYKVSRCEKEIKKKNKNMQSTIQKHIQDKIQQKPII